MISLEFGHHNPGDLCLRAQHEMARKHVGFAIYFTNVETLFGNQFANKVQQLLVVETVSNLLLERHVFLFPLVSLVCSGVVVIFERR